MVPKLTRPELAATSEMTHSGHRANRYSRLPILRVGSASRLILCSIVETVESASARLVLISIRNRPEALRHTNDCILRAEDAPILRAQL